MDADKIVEVLLGGSQLQHSSEALGHLASVGTQVVEADDFLLENINFLITIQYHYFLCRTF